MGEPPLPAVGFRLRGRISLADVRRMGEAFDHDYACSVNRADGFAPEEHGIGRLVAYPGMPPAYRTGRLHLTGCLLPGMAGGMDAVSHRLRTRCGLEDRAYRFFGLEETAFARPGEPDLDALAEEGLLCLNCFRRQRAGD